MKSGGVGGVLAGLGIVIGFLGGFPQGARADTPVEMLQSALDAYFGGRFDESVHYFERVVAADPGNARARNGLRNAQRKLREQIQRNRLQERKSIFAAEQFLAQGKLVEAHDRVKDILSRAPHLPEGQKLAKKIRAKLDKDLQKAKPGSSLFHERTGDLAYMEGDWFKAVDSWEKVLVFNKDRADLLQRLELAKKRLADEQKSERVKVLMGLARAHMDQGLFAEALAVVNDVLQSDPTNADARSLLNDARRAGAQARQAKIDGQIQELSQKAMDAFSSGREKAALGLFNQVLDLDPDNRLASEYKNRLLHRDPTFLDEPVAASKIASTDLSSVAELVARTQFTEAIELLERRLEKNPNDLKAQQMLDQARSSQRDMAEGAYREALTAFAKGDRSESIRLLQESRRLDPDFNRAKQALIKIMQEGTE